MTFTKEQREAKEKLADEIAARRENKIMPLIKIAKAQYEIETTTKLNMIKNDHADFFSMIKKSFNGEKTISDRYWSNEQTIDPLVEECLKSFTTFQNYLSARNQQLDQVTPNNDDHQTDNEKKMWIVINIIKEFERYTTYFSKARIELEILEKTKSNVLRKFYDDQRKKYGIDSYFQPIFDQEGNPDEKTKGLLLRSGVWKN